MDTPLVTIVCLSYRHAPWVRAALASVRAQTYPRVELIVVDDASPDGSADEARRFLAETNTPAQTLFLSENVGNCRAFNRALSLANGRYVIDLAADDALRPDRVARQVSQLEAVGPGHAVAFSDAWLVDAAGRVRGRHYRPGQTVPEGDVYAALLGRFFLLSPTVMYRTEALRALGGYDETLAYEDFDVLLRLARRYRFSFSPEPLTYRRVVPGSLSTRFYRRRNALLEATLRICQKAQAMNQTPTEDRALAYTVRYHLRQAVLTDNRPLARRYDALLRSLPTDHPTDRFWRALTGFPLPLGGAYDRFRRLRERVRP